jgi:hypothetical protein
MKRSGNTLVATLLTVAIILVLVVVMFKGTGIFGIGTGVGPGSTVKARPDGLGTTVVGAVRYDAKDQVCRSNLASLRQAIQLATQSNDDHPLASLEDTHLGKDMYSCPVGHEPYKYDPATGQVHCVHPGHENY